MLQTKEMKPSGFRELTPEELTAVSGGVVSFTDGTAQKLREEALARHDPYAIDATLGDPNDTTFVNYTNEGSDNNFDWFPSNDGTYAIQDNGIDGDLSEIIVTYDLDDARRWSAFAEDATYWTQLYLKTTATMIGAEIGLNAFLAEKLGISIGFAAAAPTLSVEALTQLTKDGLLDFWFDYARGIEERPAEYPLENQGNNPVGIIYSL